MFVLNPTVRQCVESIWLFPVLLLIPLVILTALRINGSSMGMYHKIFYGDNSRDTALIANHPQFIRSDEWQWNSQMILAQTNNSFARTNQNLGQGQDMSVTVDAPYKDWSELFKPANLVFFVLPAAAAFAFKWWFMSYLLTVACYLFIVALVPGRRLFAALMALALLFNPFIQWWYQYITIAPLAFGFLMAVVYMRLLHAKDTREILLLGAVGTYLLTCFILILYPPFQIPCALAVAVFCLAYVAQAYRRHEILLIRFKAIVVAAAALLAIGLSGLFVLTRFSAISATTHTVYPGNRTVQSGGYDILHLLSGFMDEQLLSPQHVAAFQLPKISSVNQSEESNFILLLPFLFLPGILVLWNDWQGKRQTNWPLAAVNATFLFFLIWLFVPHLRLLGEVTLLNRVPGNRLLIGFGMLGIMQLALTVRALGARSTFLRKQGYAVSYALLIFVCEASLGFLVKHAYPGFIGDLRILAFAIPVPVVMYCILMRYDALAAAGMLAFAIFSTAAVNPLYRGIGTLADTPVSTAIRDIHAFHQHDKWAAETPYLENFVLMNGVSSLAGTYSYPQLSLWKQVPDTNPDIYNRFSHTRFVFNRSDQSIPTSLSLFGGGDQIVINTDPCSQFLQANDVHYLITEVPITGHNICLKTEKIINYPAKTIYIYRVH